MNSELLTYEITTHNRELQHEAEQRRLLAHLPAQRNAAVRHTIALCGVMLVRVGMKLKQAEMYGEPQTI
jgi:hypothetical protein